MSLDRISAAMARTGDFVRALTGWRRIGFAFAAGAVSATAFAPLNLFPALLLGYAALVLLIDARPRVRDAALAGWAFAFGQFLIGLHWIGYAFLVDPSAHLWQMPFALLFLTAGLGLFGALAAGLAARFWSFCLVAVPDGKPRYTFPGTAPGAARHLVFAICWSLSEWLRGHVFTGFPWNLSAYGWGASLAVLESASIMGAYGLSLLTILLGASLADLYSSPRRVIAPVTMLTLFAGIWTLGAISLAVTPRASVPGVHLRLVQPDIPQAEKYRRQFVIRNWSRLVSLSQQSGNPNVIIWPEAAPPFLLAAVPEALDQIAALTAPGRILITGAERIGGTPENRAYYNSLYMFAPGRAPLVYDKFHLVPFGEYVPFASLLNRIGVTKLTAGEAGFSAGDGPHSYVLPGVPRVAPLICYEVIFPGQVTPSVIKGGRPGWFVNVTDDSWFGPWAGPRQHLLIARVRAIEEAVPIVRVANTGISAVIDPLGRLETSLSLGETGILDSVLPKARGPSLYARLGDLVFACMILLAGIVAFLLARR